MIFYVIHYLNSKDQGICVSNLTHHQQWKNGLDAGKWVGRRIWGAKKFFGVHVLISINKSVTESLNLVTKY